MLSFVLGHAFHGWHSTIKPVKFILALTTVHGYWDYFTNSSYLGLYYFSLAWVTIFIGLTVWAMQSFVRNQFAALWPLKLLRSIGSFSATVLYIPLFTLLMSGFQCQDHEENPFWMDAGYRCYVGGHLAQAIVSAILTITFFALCSLFSLVFYESNSLSGNIVAKSHGRVDFLFLCLKTVLVILVEIFPSHIPVGVLIALLIVGGLVWSGAILLGMPFFDHRWNAWTLAQGVMFLYASLCLILAEFYHEHDAAVTLYIGLPMAAILGVSLANWRAGYILRTPALRLSSPYEIELKARYLLHQALWGHHTSRHGTTNHSNEATPGTPLENTKGHPSATLNATGNGGYGEGAAVTTIEDAEGSDDMEVRMQAARRMLSPALMNEIHALYRSAASRFRSSSILHVFFSRFYLFQGNRHMQMSHLLQAERRHPPLDVAFLVFQARKLAEDNTGSGGQMSALNRVTFEKYSADARKFVLRSAMRQLSFWTELLDTQPDLSRLHTLSSEMNDAISAAERCFIELFAINPQSLSIMRLYAAFNSYVCCNPDKAAVLLQEAERIEDQKSKDHRTESGGTNLQIMAESTLDIMADNTAVFTIGGQPRNLGIIITANAQTSKLFGYSRLQLERRNFFSLLPNPLGLAMENMLRRYVSTGEGKIASTHVVFGQNKSGSISPMLLCMRETPADEGPPAFIALMRELRTVDDHILMTADYTITAASSASLEMLGIDASSLGGMEVCIRDFVLEWDAIVNDLRSNRGATFCIDSTSAQANLASQNEGGTEEDIAHAVFSTDTLTSRNHTSDNNDLDGGTSIRRNSGSHSFIRASKRFVKGTLQVVPVIGGDQFLVLHMQKISDSDTYAIAKAQKRRRELLQLTSPNNTTISPHDGTVNTIPQMVPSENFPTQQSFEQAQSVSRMFKLLTNREPTTANNSATPSNYIPNPVVISPSPPRNNLTSPMTKANNLTIRGPSEVTSPVPVSLPSAMKNSNTPKVPKSVGMVGFAELPGTVEDSAEPSPIAPTKSSPRFPVEKHPSKHIDDVVHVKDSDSVEQLSDGGHGSDAESDKASFGERDEELPSIDREHELVHDHAHDTEPPVRAIVSPTGTTTSLSMSKSLIKPPSATNNPLSPRKSFEDTPRSKGNTTGKEFGAARQETQSVSSGSSYGRRTLNRLRRVLADSGNSLLRGLYFLRIVGLLITVLSIALAIAAATVMQDQFTRYRDNLIYTSLGAERVIKMFSMVLITEDLHFAARGWRPITNVTEASLRSYLYANASDFSAIHREMYRSIQGEELESTYTIPNIVVTRYDTTDAGNTGAHQTVNLFQAGLGLSSTAAEISMLPLSNLTSERSPPVGYMLVNGVSGGHSHERVHESLEAGYAMSLDTRSSVALNAIIVYAGMSALLAVIAAFVFVPILLSIESSKDAIVKRFVYLPQLVRLTLHKQAENRLRALRRNYSEDDDDDDDDMADDEENMLGNAGVDDDEDDVDWEQILSAANNPAPKRKHKENVPPIPEVPVKDKKWYQVGSLFQSKKRSVPAYQKGTGSIIGLFAKFLGPLIALFFFFTIIYIVSVDTLSRTLSISSAQVASANRAACLRETLMDVQRTVMITQDRAFLHEELMTTKDSFQCIAYHQELLLFGTVDPNEDQGEYPPYTPVMETGAQPLLDDATNKALYDVQFSNACPFIVSETSSTSDMAGCEKFSNGILKQGIQVAVTEYLRRARTILDRRQRALILQGDPDGNGYVVDFKAYNYTADECDGPCWSSSTDTGENEPSPAPDLGVTGDIDQTWNPLLHNATPYCIKDELNQPDITWMAQADALFLTPALLRIQHIYEDIGIASVDNFLRFLNVFVTVFIVAFVLFMISVFVPQIKATNNDIQKKRGMLLFLPPQVVINIKSLRQLVDEILADDTTGGARAAAHTSRLASIKASGGDPQDDNKPAISRRNITTEDGVQLVRSSSFLGIEKAKRVTGADIEV